MKKRGLILVLGLVILSSCKRDWACKCSSGGSSTQIESYSGLKKKDAEVKCADVQKDFEEFNANLSCEVEKI